MKDLLIFPFGGNAREALASVQMLNQRHSEWKVVGFVDDSEAVQAGAYAGVPVIGGRDVFKRHADAQVLAVPGHPKVFMDRKRIICDLGVTQDRWATVIDPSARIAPGARIGQNVLILANVAVGPDAVIGDHCVILPGTVVGHDTRIGAFTVIGANVSLSGHCVIGQNCYLGTSASFRDHVRVGDGTLVGLGAVVVKVVEGGVVVIGNPAKVLKQVK